MSCISRRSSYPIVGLLLLALLAAGCSALPIRTPGGTVPVSTDTPTEEVATEEPSTEESASGGVSAAEGPVVTGVEEYNGMTVGFTAEGLPFRGDPNAPVIMNEFSDYQCPYCARHFVQTEPAINESLVKTGELMVVFRDLPLVDLHPNAPAAHEAALCVADQGAALFWAMHDQIFRTQTVWSNLSDPTAELANLAGVAGADLDAYNNCMAGNEREADVQARLNEGLALGFNGTPSFMLTAAGASESYSLVGAQPYDVFAQNISALAAGEVPPIAAEQEAAAAQTGIPAWAAPEGNAVDPNNPGFTLFGDQTRGNADAPVVIVEFSDFQCPYCARHHVDTQPVLDEQFVDTGKVRFVYKHFPLPNHPQAPAAGIAAECASDQGAFWEMYDLLFATIDTWSVSDPSPALIDLADQLELDTDAFAACLEDEAVAARIAADMSDGAQYVQGTPTFIILYGQGGQIIPGALPAETFVEELNRILGEIGG